MKLEFTPEIRIVVIGLMQQIPHFADLSEEDCIARFEKGIKANSIGALQILCSAITLILPVGEFHVKQS